MVERRIRRSTIESASDFLELWAEKRQLPVDSFLTIR